jgi:hypothetical protein
MQGDSAVLGLAKAPARSRVTNGNEMLPGIDGRSWYARRARDLVALFVVDQGGAESVSEAEKAIIRRCAILCVELENLETQFAKAGAADPAALDLYQRTANSLRRMLETLGLKRVPKDVSPPPIGEYLRSIDAEVTS